VGIGVVSPECAQALGFTGADAARLRRGVDLRKKQPYEVYDRMDFDIPVARTATATTATSCACRRCASRTASSASASGGCARTPAR